MGHDNAPLAQKLEVGYHASDIDIDIETWAASVIESITDVGRITIDSTSLASTHTKKRKSKKARNLPPIPTTLTQAKNLLMRRAHVNLWDYMAAREPDMPDPKSNEEKVIGGPPKNYAYLVWPNQKALVEYTLRTEKIVSKDQAKEEWLQPVLKEICKLQLKYDLASRFAGAV